jgi:hypothetical protein
MVDSYVKCWEKFKSEVKNSEKITVKVENLIFIFHSNEMCDVRLYAVVFFVR